MDPWLLPGPAGFLRRVERSLRDGASVVARFPRRAQADFSEQVLTLLDRSWQCTVFHPEPTRPPFESLRDRFAPQLSSDWSPSLLDLCEQHEFQGRLIWVDGLDYLDPGDWCKWKQFFVDYAQASRSVREFERTLFVAVLSGVPPADPPQQDVTLTTHDWRDVVDEMDLLFLAYERLGHRDMSPTMHSLLATTVARVAAWDLEIAERLLDEERNVILDPVSMLRSVAHENGWTADMPSGWGVGTASGSGSRHAVLAALDDPPREVRRRVWSAQVSVLLPAIHRLRIEIIQKYRVQLASYLESEGMAVDPLDLDFPDLADTIHRPGFDRSVRRRVQELRDWRNNLAHLEILDTNAVRFLAAP